MDADKALTIRRGHIKGSITRLKNTLTEEFLESASLQMLSLKEQNLNNLFNQYNDILIEINDEEDPVPVENTYYKYMDILRTQINKKTHPENIDTKISVTSKLQLPSVQIPPFEGKYLEYKSFIELFTALVHKDNSINDVQKFVYLRSFLKGEAFDLIKNLPVVGASYKEALTILQERYDNKHKIVFEHISHLLDLSPITKPNEYSLRNLVSEVKQHIAALKNLDQPIDKWDSVLVCILSRKLDPHTNRSYCLKRDTSIPPTFTEFIKYLESRALAMENSNRRTCASFTEAKPRVTNIVTKPQSCGYCGKLHKLFLCPKFMLAPVDERLQFVKNKNLCKICLNFHTQKCRYYFKCAHCKLNHNTLLHNEKSVQETAGGRVVLLSELNSINQVLLPTAKVKVLCKDGKELIVKALLDSASQSSFITSNLSKRLKKPLLPVSTQIMGITNTGKNIQYAVKLDIFSCIYPYKVNVNCLVVDKITTKLPQNNISLSNINIPKNISLADNTFNMSSEIDMLLSADILFQALLPQREEYNKLSDPAQPSLVHTQFGYIIAGNISVQSLQNAAVSLFCQECSSDIDSTITRFWQSEAVPELFTEHTSEQQYCEQYYKDTVKIINNKFEVSMPLKIPICDINKTLGDSFGLALHRYLNLEKRFKRNNTLYQEYKKFIHEYIALGHASYFDITKYDLSKDMVYFMPHHSVLRENAMSTRLRVVFDGSMKTSNKISLNDIMSNGPVVQKELFDILLLFRLNKYFFISDIKHMFRNILIDKDQRSLQNILWRDNPDESIRCLQLNTVTYGLKSSPYLATRCLNELVYKFQHEYPLAAPVILHSTYVDDILYSHNDLKTIIDTKQQLIELLAKGSFNLHKWSANDAKILQNISKEQQCSGDISIQNDIKTLGLKFNINLDSFKFSPPPEQTAKTKREILSYISKFYDPLGLIGPIFVKAKQIMQKLWQSKTDWDSIPSPNIEKEWQLFYNDLLKMSPIIVQRCVSNCDKEQFQLIGFSDGSNVAYGCAIYLRVTDSHGNVKMFLLCSKSRINSLTNKQMSMPRIELNAALILAKLSLKVYHILSLKLLINKVYLFTDSQVVLAWLKINPIKLNTYVANRVKAINEYAKDFNWLYVSTSLNPADCLSRGVSPSELYNHKLWWSGPPVMSNLDYTFNDNCNFEIPTNLPEIKISVSNRQVCAVSQSFNNGFLDSFLCNYSCINKAQRVLAYILRFCNNIKPNSDKIKHNFISFAESSEALHLIIKNEQYKYFQKEIHSIQNIGQAQSHLKALNPFVDKNGLLRVGGRLQNAALSYEQKHQLILPKESRITHLIINYEHIKLFHASQKLVLCNLNQRYWIVNGLRLVKNIIHKCLTCFRFKADTAKQLMGSLPADRVTASRPFQKVGMDFAGPFSVKQSRARGVLITKGYIALYVCFVTKALHLELVSDLSTDTFLASFKRFIARRNVPTEVYCDNASNYKGAKNQLTEIYKLNNCKLHQAQVQSAASKMGINFHFIPSYSPTFGGLWEAAVKSVKYHLKRVLGTHIFTYEQLYTVLVQIEGVLNSRPLLPMSSDINDVSFLTPGHFLTGAPLTCLPEQNLVDLPENRLKFWEKCTAIKHQFWRYWSKHYLNILQNRPKWKDSLPNIKVGDLVILKEIDTPPMTWPMARVTKIFPGNDGKVRAMEVKKANGRCHKTSITKVCILPLE